jgi:xylulokinase
MDVFLGFDFGTSAIKAAAMDAEGRVLASARVPSSTLSPREGWFEVEVEKTWYEGFLAALEQLGAENVASARALCVSSLCATFVPVDAGLRPLYNAILYGIDTRASAQVERLNAACDEATLAAVAGGGAFTSHSVIPKLLWLRETMPEVYAATAQFLESGNYITSRLTGETAWDLPSAAGGHLVDVRSLRYPSRLLDSLGIEEGKLPRLASPLDAIGSVTASASAATGIPAGAMVLAGACDINAEAFACGAVYPGDLTVVYGSTVSTLFVLDSPKSVPGFLTGPSVLPGTYRLGGATSSGGRYLDWARRALALGESENGLDAASPTKIVMLPYLDGARTPVQDPRARALWYGMSSATDRAALWTAAKESMGYELSSILDRLSAAAPLPDALHVMGGLSRDERFMRIVSDITGKSLLRFPEVDASYGDCLMALARYSGQVEARRAGLASDEPNPRGACLVRPDPEAHERYAPYARLYGELSSFVSSVDVSPRRIAG